MNTKTTTAQVLGKTFPHPIFEFIDTVAFLVAEGEAQPIEKAAKDDMDGFQATFIYMAKAATPVEAASGDYKSVHAAILQCATTLAAYYWKIKHADDDAEDAEVARRALPPAIARALPYVAA